MMKPVLSAVAILVAAICLSDAFDNTVSSVQLLQNKAVQKELAITEAQRTKMNQYANDFNKQAQAYQAELAKKSDNGKKPVQRDAAREQKMLVDLKNKVLSQLSAKQIKRLRELSLQAVGVTALGDDAVASKVGLSITQKDKIRSLVKSGLEGANKLLMTADQNASKGIAQPKSQAEAEKAQKLYETRRIAEQKKIQGKLDAIRNGTIKNVMAVLDAKQRAAWTALLGKTFNG